MKILVTPGDPDGIGPEILCRLLQKRPSWAKDLIAIGSLEALEKAGARVEAIESIEAAKKPLRLRGGPVLRVLPAPLRAPRGRGLPGYQSGWSVEAAVAAILKGQAEALVTGPIHKMRLQKGGYPFAGHTDLLASLCGQASGTMMLANSRLRVSLVTVHVPLKRVPQVLTQASILRTVQHTFDFLRRMNPAKQSRIAVLALNPHAGEAGLLGTEEKTVITPAIRKAQKIYGKKALIQGPFPADSFFAKHTSDFDAVVAMYHDQGLIPVKLIDFNATVNVTLGLPIIRTSVDHGTAFDIVGKGVASHASLEAAIELARKICQKA